MFCHIQDPLLTTILFGAKLDFCLLLYLTVISCLGLFVLFCFSFGAQRIMVDVEPLKGIQKPAAFAIVCFCFCEFRTVSYSGSCGALLEGVQSMLVFALPLMRSRTCSGRLTMKTLYTSSLKVHLHWCHQFLVGDLRACLLRMLSSNRTCTRNE